jgi:hypothetical protein
MQLWVGQIIAQFLWKGYLFLEGSAVKRLVDYETCVIESLLPITESTDVLEDHEPQRGRDEKGQAGVQ